MSRITLNTIAIKCAICGSLSNIPKKTGQHKHNCPKCSLSMETNLTELYIEGITEYEGYKEEDE